ncbi:CBF-domain-containing protein [Meira miltonrushii]|uniref:CBF-domain-containing protein n=1 Tax=Meira miltonrushii TaxID=1280837 RepID=A0A316VBC0_9BASI|nr:CBF-domain-containing protein [Meira miltonrushii]PWN32865.1 CBF-domain-containing protein [Meira miltonrushii]
MPAPSLPPKRQSKSKSEAESSTKTATTLDKQLSALFASLSNSSDLNPLIDLTSILRQHLVEKINEKHINSLRKGVQFLVRSFQALLKEDRISLRNVDLDGKVQLGSESGNGPEHQVAKWLQDRWNDAVLLLNQLLHCVDEEARLLALHSLMSLQRDASSSLTREVERDNADAAEEVSEVRVQWSQSPWDSFTLSVLTNEGGEIEQDVIGEFTEKYLQEYDDVRFAFCRKVSDFLQGKASVDPSLLTNTRRKAAEFMIGVTAIPTKDEHINTFLVPEIVKKKRKASAVKTNGSKKGKKVDDEDEEEEEEMDDWFSDSDDEGGKGKVKKEKKNTSLKSTASGLGSAARSAADAASTRQRLRRNPPFYLAVQSYTAQKAAFARAWISIVLATWVGKSNAVMLGGSLEVTMKHEILVRMHVQIIPHLPKPSLLHDFLVDALDAGGATALLALNTLFTLMTKHNLNYPAFYTRLYALLLDDPPFLHVRFRSRFLRLLDTFLSSTHLSATLIASFAKRLSRAALRAPPSAIVVVVPFVWNLCKRHKRCLNLIHRNFSEDRFDQGPAGIEDPYDALEVDPLKTNAIDSSLWEIAAMGSLLGASYQTTAGVMDGEGQAHYLASVSSLSKILAEPFTKERYGLEDFLDLTYTTMFETDTNKTLKRREGKKIYEPAVASDLPRNANGKRALTFASGGTEYEDAQQVKKTKLVEGEEEQDVETVEQEDEELREARQAIKEATEKEQSSVLNRIFVF